MDPLVDLVRHNSSSTCSTAAARAQKPKSGLGCCQLGLASLGPLRNKKQLQAQFHTLSTMRENLLIQQQGEIAWSDLVIHLVLYRTDLCVHTMVVSRIVFFIHNVVLVAGAFRLRPILLPKAACQGMPHAYLRCLNSEPVTIEFHIWNKACWCKKTDNP